MRLVARIKNGGKQNLQGVTTTESIDGGWFASRPEFVIDIQLADSPIVVSPLIRCRWIYAKFGATRTQPDETTESSIGINARLGAAPCSGK